MSASWKLLGEAMHDFYTGETDIEIIEHSFWGKRKIPLSYYFRNENEMPDTEIFVLDLCCGRVLEVGAGAGNHSLVLQSRGLEVCPVDINPEAVEIMKKRGLSNARCIDFFSIENEQYDSILLMMNGIGFIGTLDRLSAFLEQCRKLLKPGGILLFDSADIAGDRKADIHYLKGKYPGEVKFHFEYKAKSGLPFKWLFLDSETLRQKAREAGWQMQIIFQNEEAEYLAMLRPVQ